MKGLYFLFLIMTLLLTAGLGYSAEKKKEDTSLPNPYVTTYPFESAVIYYSGKIEYGHQSSEVKTSKGIEVVYIEGDKVAKVTKMTVPGPKGKIKNVEALRIITPEYVYMIDLIGKNGIKLDNSKKYGKVAYSNLSEEEKKAFHERMERRGIISLELLGLGKKVGTDTILGRKCDVYEYGKKLSPKEMMTALQAGQDPFYMKSWIWSEAKIPLKVVSEQMGSLNELVATNIKVNVKIPDSQFKVPSDVKVTYDEYKSESAKQATLARFNLYKTGQPMVVRMKVKKEDIGANPYGSSKSSETGQKTQGEDRNNHTSNNLADVYSERIYNYISNLFD